MAVTPRDAAKLNDESERKSVKLMEASIDQKLGKEFRTGHTVEIWAATLRKTPGWTKRAQEHVFKKYRASGWQVNTKLVPDRQGSETVYEFKEAPVAPSHDFREQAAPPPWYEDRNTYPYR
jgi:hypothetical protein